VILRVSDSTGLKYRQEFAQFLSVIDGYNANGPARPNRNAVEKADRKIVRGTIVHSDWAGVITDRAFAVIAMFDPNQHKKPKLAVLRVRVSIRPSAFPSSQLWLGLFPVSSRTMPPSYWPYGRKP
jgi:hypothetical protein